MAQPNQNPNQQNQNPQAPQASNGDTSPQKPQPAKERKFLVEESAEIPRGGSNYRLSKGKTISSHGYDIAALQRQGVKLREVSDPGN